MADFIIEPLSNELKEQLEQGTTELLGNPVTTVIADAKPGYPCRLSLEDAEPGEALYLFSHTPFSCANAYRETGPVFIRKNAKPAKLPINELPDVAYARSIIFRAYDSEGTILSASPAEAGDLSGTLGRLLDDKHVDFVHLRAVVSGCFLCKARRA